MNTTTNGISGPLEKVSMLKPGACPNFYLSGPSAPALEKLGMELAKTLIEKKLLPFKGIVKSFTIRMPYFEDSQSEDKFLEHLKDSVSIARDCYDRFCGIILIELEQEWAKSKECTFIGKFCDYIKKNRQICFVLLFPAAEQAVEKTFYRRLSSCSIWMRLEPRSLSPEECVTLFREMANEEDYTVSEKAETLLLEELRERKETDIENADAVAQVFRQILFERSLDPGKGKEIAPEEVMVLAAEEKEEKKTFRIGFAADLF